MRILKAVVVALLVVVVVLAAVGLVLPDKVHVERSIVVDAAPETVFPLLNDFRQFNRWSPWYGRDPVAEYQFDGPESGVGAKMTWHSEQADVGSGSQEIVVSEPNRTLQTKLDFGSQGTAKATFTLLPEGEKTRVTWGLDSEFGYNLPGRYFGLFFDRMVGPDYEQGLRNLKEVAEAGG